MPGSVVSEKLAQNVKADAEKIEFNGQSVWKYLVEGVLWNSSARLEVNDGSDPNNKEPYITRGNVTEQGLIKFFMGALSGQGCVDQKGLLTEEKILSVISFSSSRKRASIVVRNADKAGTNQEVRVYTKGAPDMVLETTDKVLAADGSVASLDDTV
jgi:magnesium-transporting ATPase (P-type)